VSIEQVVNSLVKLNDAHLILLETAEDKKRSILENDMDALNRIVAKENKMMKNIIELERLRTAAVDEFLKQRGFAATQSMTISTLIRMVVKAEEKQALSNAQSTLSDTLQKLKQLNAINQQLIKQSLEFIEYSIDLLSGSSEQEITYSNQPQHSKGYGPGLFDTKA
jgi:flagellar biosynthesis/type III secretory pathway chaperone